LACLAIGAVASSTFLFADDAPHKEVVQGLVVKVYQVADLALPLTSSTPEATPDFESLIDLIELRTGADCWADGGGQGSIRSDVKTMSLIVRQTQAVHEAIATLLDEMRGTGDLALCVETNIITADLDACETGKPTRTAEGLVDSAGRQRLIKLAQTQKDSTIHWAPKVTFFNGHSAQIETKDDRGSTKVGLRGVVSKDNRYARLWIDTTINDQHSSTEALVPEGHTAVRKLPGENRWLLVTSHVINAEEPEIIAPIKTPTPAGEQKRYLVPVDESVEPTELTGVPQFKAQAESFGDSVAQRVAQRVEQASHVEICEATAAGDESPCESREKPALARAVEKLEYQTAMAEPGHCTGQAPEPKTVIGFAMLEDDQAPAEVPQPITRGGFFTVEVHQNPDGVLTITPRPDSLIGRRDVVHAFSNISAENDPPARLDVCLDGVECPSASTKHVQPGEIFERVFAQPTVAPAFPLGTPLPAKPQAMVLHGYRVYEPTAAGPFQKWADNLGGLRPRTPNKLTAVPAPAFEPGRALLSAPKVYPYEYGVIVEHHVTPGLPRFQFVHPGHDQLQLTTGFDGPDAEVQRVVAVSRIEIAPVNEMLSQAAEQLVALGLPDEANTVRKLIGTIATKAHERSTQIEQEIARLRAEQERLKPLADSAANDER
jgi:hypothetical protein